MAAGAPLAWTHARSRHAFYLIERFISFVDAFEDRFPGNILASADHSFGVFVVWHFFTSSLHITGGA